MDIICRSLQIEKEISAAADIEKECLSTAWSKAQIADLPEYGVYIGAFADNTLLGVASMYIIAGEGQIMNIAVLPDARGKGIGLQLMESLISRAADKNCEIITLEVAEDNKAAISLYEKLSFRITGRRKGFYNGRDALNMEKIL